MDTTHCTVPLEDFALELLFKTFVSHCDNIVPSLWWNTLLLNLEMEVMEK